jgi:hypothetical protein
MTKDVNSKYTEMLNEMLSAENAALDTIKIKHSITRNKR